MGMLRKLLSKIAIHIEYFYCDIPPKAFESAKKLNPDISNKVQVESVLFMDGTVKRNCPYYKPVNIDGEEVYRCLPMELPSDLKECPENIENIIESDYNGCKCKFE